MRFLIVVAVLACPAIGQDYSPETFTIPAIVIPSPDPEWTYPGEIRQHLAGPNHKVDASGMSTAEAERLHDQLHNAERYGTPVAFGQPLALAPELFASPAANCPNGQCPVVRRQPVRSAMGSAVIRSRSIIGRSSRPIRRWLERFRSRRSARRARLFGMLMDIGNPEC